MNSKSSDFEGSYKKADIKDLSKDVKGHLLSGSVEKVQQLSSDRLREICIDEGADDAGFVEIGREALAFELDDIIRVYPGTKTLISIVKTVNRESVQSIAINIADEEFHKTCDNISSVSQKILHRLNKLGIRGVCTTYAFPSDMNRWPGKLWDISHKVVAVEAGLGHMGLNRLVLHPRYGSFITLTTILINAVLDRHDQKLDANACIDCKLCSSVCPVGAIQKDGQFEFMACFTHSYREMLSGFQDWIEKIVSSGKVSAYRSQFCDSETISMWQSLTYGFNYKCSYCMAVCPAGEDVINSYLPHKKEYITQVVSPLKHKPEPVYVLKGTLAEITAKKNPDKDVRYVQTPIRPKSISDFLLGVKLAFNPLKANDFNVTIHFIFTGKEEVSATICIDKEKINVQEGTSGKASLTVRADSESWIKFLNKEISLFRAVFSRKLKIHGNPLLMKKFQDCLVI